MADSAAGLPVTGAEPHEILGVSRNASAATIRRQFLKEAKQWHPDKRPQGESQEDSARARGRFVAIHAAYEALAAAAGDEEVEEASTVADLFSGADEALANARAQRQEAEEYMNELLAETQKPRSWTEEELKVLHTTWIRACRALESLRRTEAHAEVQAEYKAGLEARQTKPRTAVPAPAQPAAIDGPRTMSDHIEGVGEAFKEMYEDMRGYFTLWRSARPRSANEALTAE
mmetsp:Transcript_16684/g.29194  ORF Transcript_16684/g.29194 Transcript_16684/m.29194 type:complete len:231 (+) Transcript_16684:11-703(+)|eukprot:CAMPEP_0197656448 /NCGR_PEP_ID=MMETSP1338-20131121/41916_1 /TAXON_ID=43686 ORGANISM="Pelagodinium beii, Strain RCC1491" /NCGR_SAMPLE_ID=MMETSP1338 /ASSEMBLY_ACC=CAM_ASM_000754 /LENGTH=230 /DNA_ID=CAMNT_0043232447 /DNA_START=11 /DNA_END=703 /DNA_ORIENTATION=+